MTKTSFKSNAAFRLMAIKFRQRDRKLPPAKILQEVCIRSGMSVLDFGCGPGSFSLAAARLVGPAGRVYALDIHPLAVKSLQRGAEKAALSNIRVLHGSDLADFEAKSLDLVLLYDLLHELPEPKAALIDIHRVLRPNGRLSVNDHHMKEEELVAAVTGAAPFRRAHSGRWTYEFERVEENERTP